MSTKVAGPKSPSRPDSQSGARLVEAVAAPLLKKEAAPTAAARGWMTFSSAATAAAAAPSSATLVAALATDWVRERAAEQCLQCLTCCW